MRGQIIRIFFMIFLAIMAMFVALTYSGLYAWEGRAMEGLLVLQDVANFKKAYLQVISSPTDNISLCYKMRIKKECTVAIVKEHPMLAMISYGHDVAAGADLPVLAYGGEVVLPEFDNCGAQQQVTVLPGTEGNVDNPCDSTPPQQGAQSYANFEGDTTCCYQCAMWFRMSKERVKEGGAYKTKVKVLQHPGDGCN